MAGLAMKPATDRLSDYEESLLPAAHRKVAEEIDAALDGEGDAPTPEPAPVETPPVAPPDTGDTPVVPSGKPAIMDEPSVKPAEAVPTDVEGRLARFESELAAMRDRNDATERALEEAREENARLRSELTQHPAAPVKPVEVPLDRDDFQEYFGLTDDEMDSGMETHLATRKIIHKEVPPMLDAVKREVIAHIDRQMAGIGTTVASAARTAQAAYEQERLRLIPDFDDINNDPGFETYLDGTDVRTRAPRRALANAANKAQDAEALSVFFDEYRQSAGRPKPAVTPSVASQVTPSQKGGGSAPAGPGAKKRYTNEEYMRETSRVNQLRASNPKAADALEAELDAAAMEGRVGTQ